MFQLLQSIWMLTAAGIIIPVIIHFWNRKQGKTLKVGSISLLAQSYKQQAKSLQLQERLLLLLRCLLILLAAFAVSHPVLNRQLNPEKQQGWILMEKQGLQPAYSQFKPVIDSLIKRNYEFHYFDAAFEKTNLEKALKNKPDSVTPNNFSYWSLLSALDQRVPATLPVYLFTANSLKRFAGTRPQVAMNLQWYTYTSKDSVSKWLAKAYITTADSIRLVAANSQPSGTSYYFKNAAIGSDGAGEYKIHASNNTISASYQNSASIEVDTTTLHLTIFTNKNKNDGAYVKAACEAVQQYSKRKLKLSVVSDVAAIPRQQDWLFWLTEDKLPGVDAKNIFMYADGKPETFSSSIHTEDKENDNEPVTLYKRIIYKPASTGLSKATWLDGFGSPLLEMQVAAVPIYRFYSRFDPSWSDLPWSSAFPRIMFNLLWNEPGIMPVADNRAVDEQQLQPVFAAESKTISKQKLFTTYDLSYVFWIAALILFFTERYLSFKIKTEKTNA